MGGGDGRELDFYSWTFQTYGIGTVKVPRPEAGFHASVETAALADVSMIEVTSDPVVLERTRRDISRADFDLVTVGLVLEGSGVVVQGGREARVSASDIVLAESQTPFVIGFDSAFRQAW